MRWKAFVIATFLSANALAAEEPIPWFADAYPVALSIARLKKVPVVVDLWAPWCHTCLSMQSFVFKDDSLKTVADRFVWVAVDTEKASNASVLTKLPVEVWPTFYVLDPANESVAARQLGSMSIQQLRSFLDDGERAVAAAHKNEMKPGDPLALLAAGDAAAIQKKHAEAARLYGEALAKTPRDWPRRGPALVSRIRSLQKIPDPSACVDLALAEAGSTGEAAAAGDFLSFGLDCADALPKTDARVAKLRGAALPRLTALAGDPSKPLSADDRGDMWRMVWDIEEKLGNAAGARIAAERRLAVLDVAVAKAPDAWAASTYDGARMETYLYLGQPDAAVAFLKQSEAALPTDYNPSARLARAYLEWGRFGEALAAVDRALPKAYGPRKAQIFRLKADILEKQGRLDDAAKVVGEEIALWESLPAEQRRAPSMEAARKRLESLRATAQKKL